MSSTTLSGTRVGARSESSPTATALEALEWQEQAACLPDRLGLTEAEIDSLFFPERGGTARRAREICAGCPVRARCLAWALEVDLEFGVFGGTSPKERRQLKRERKQLSLLARRLIPE